MSIAPLEKALDASIPLCFDTNAVFGKGAGPRFLGRLRRRFPSRGILLPVLVIAERTRQLRQEFKEGYNDLLVNNFLDDRQLALTVVAFDREVVPRHWLDVVSVYDNAAWADRERERFVDHGVYASARARGAILVTNEHELRGRVIADNYHPGTLTGEELTRLMDAHPAGP